MFWGYVDRDDMSRKRVDFFAYDRHMCVCCESYSAVKLPGAGYCEVETHAM